jgi:ABC-2 type transport system ATP-binding protein
MTSAAPVMLSVAGLSKRYGKTLALNDLSFELPAGQFVALLGPNGAGKSTLFQVLTGLFAPDAGQVAVAGISLREAPRALAHIGVVFQQMSLDLDLSVQRNLLFQAALHGLRRTAAHERIGELSQALGIAGDLKRVVRELSGGNRRKVELVRALLHQPAVLLMDEPTVGLDPKSRRDLLAAIRREVDTRRTTVLWATHLVEETQEADRVLVLHRGQMLADGTPADVTRALGGATLEEGFIARTTAPASKETSAA